jgi:cell division protease FtsH
MQGGGSRVMQFGKAKARQVSKDEPKVTFADVAGCDEAVEELHEIKEFLQSPARFQAIGAKIPKGVLLYGPPGTGKSKLVRALATASRAIFYHVKLLNLTSKFGANTGELLQEILRIATSEGPAVLLLDEAEALSLEHLLPPPAAREASARLVAALCEKLDATPAGRVLVVGATSRTDAIDAVLVAPGRLDHLVEVALPEPDAQREIMEIIKARTERNAGRTLFEPIDYRKLLPVMGGLSGADISEIIQRALEAKVHRAAEGAAPGPVTSEDLLVSIDAYKGVRGVVEKIRYGQYL